jgi:hypothetical protein
VEFLSFHEAGPLGLVAIAAMIGLGSCNPKESPLKTSLIVAAALLAAVVASPASAAPLGGVAGATVKTDGSLVEQAQHAYGRACSYGPRGWFYRNYRGEIISCRPRRPVGFGYEWREFGGRSGWYHGRDRRWH